MTNTTQGLPADPPRAVVLLLRGLAMLPLALPLGVALALLTGWAG